jgi:cell division transport system permease protein
VAGLFTAKSLFIDDVLSDLYQSNIIGQITTADVVLVSPALVAAAVVLSGLTAYVTLRLYVRQ